VSFCGLLGFIPQLSFGMNFEISSTGGFLVFAATGAIAVFFAVSKDGWPVFGSAAAFCDFSIHDLMVTSFFSLIEVFASLSKQISSSISSFDIVLTIYFVSSSLWTGARVLTVFAGGYAAGCFTMISLPITSKIDSPPFCVAEVIYSIALLLILLLISSYRRSPVVDGLLASSIFLILYCVIRWSLY